VSIGEAKLILMACVEGVVPNMAQTFNEFQ